MILPKDLLVDLEEGDRTAEHLEAKEVDITMGGNLMQATQLNQWFNQQVQASKQFNQVSNLQQAYQGGIGLGIGQIMGGQRSW